MVRRLLAEVAAGHCFAMTVAAMRFLQEAKSHPARTAAAL
jgi:hypothetical protein